MATKKKMLMSAAGSAGGGAGLDITDVFSTYLYTGNSSTQTITNGIDLDGEGGLVWIKGRSSSANNFLWDTERGLTKYLMANTTSTEGTQAAAITSFNSSGFTEGSYGGTNASGTDYASWTFRKAPKFFDVVTWTGNAVPGRTISHDLGSAPGCIMIKQITGLNNWIVYHRGLNGGTNPEQYHIYLNLTNAQEDFILFDDTAPTATEFTVGGYASVNGSGHTYVAYIFAHNDSGDGEFGPDGDQDIIKCGSYTGNGSTTGPEIDLGFEPQWVMVKRATATANWFLVDTMRGLPVGSNSSALFPNTSGAEDTNAAAIDVLPTGFQPKAGSIYINGSGNNYIYMAIRRGPLAVPEDATKVFSMDMDGTSNNSYTANHVVDFAFYKSKDNAYDWSVNSRLMQGKSLKFNKADAESSNSLAQFDMQNGWADSAALTSEYPSWMWKRAPGYFDVVTYNGDGVAGRTVSHNLGVAPEMMWVKKRNQNSNWEVYLHSQGGTKRIYLDYPNAIETTSSAWNNTDATDTVFSLGTSSQTNQSGGTFISYLFASVDGVSKVGSWSGSGGTNTQVIDCGFSAGARFVLIKRTNASQDWLVFDTERGITSGNDAKLALNNANAQSTTNWGINPNSSGFEVTGNSINETGGEWIFYAIA